MKKIIRTVKETILLEHVRETDIVIVKDDNKNVGTIVCDGTMMWNVTVHDAEGEIMDDLDDAIEYVLDYHKSAEFYVL